MTVNPDFERWAQSFSGCDGGDIGSPSSRSIWGGFKLEVQHLPPIKVRRCRHLVRLTSSFNLKIASPLPA